MELREHFTKIVFVVFIAFCLYTVIVTAYCVDILRMLSQLVYVSDFWLELLEINILKDRSKYLHKISHNSSVAHRFSQTWDVD